MAFTLRVEVNMLSVSCRVWLQLLRFKKKLLPEFRHAEGRSADGAEMRFWMMSLKTLSFHTVFFFCFPVPYFTNFHLVLNSSFFLIIGELILCYVLLPVESVFSYCCPFSFFLRCWLLLPVWLSILTVSSVLLRAILHPSFRHLISTSLGMQISVPLVFYFPLDWAYFSCRLMSVWPLLHFPPSPELQSYL